MKTTIDSAGRVVIPKALRERAGLRPGAELDIRESDGIIEIIPPPPQGRLIRKNGRLFWSRLPALLERRLKRLTKPFVNCARSALTSEGRSRLERARGTDLDGQRPPFADGIIL